MVRMDKPMKAANRSTEMMEETPSSLVEAKSGEFSIMGFASIRKKLSLKAESLQRLLVFTGTAQGGGFG